jgi:hypothetical protein
MCRGVVPHLCHFEVVCFSAPGRARPGAQPPATSTATLIANAKRRPKRRGELVQRLLIRSFSGELNRCGDDIHESAVAHDRDGERASDRVGEHEALQGLGIRDRVTAG